MIFKYSQILSQFIIVRTYTNLGIRLIERLQHGGSSLREVVAALEADMEAMYEMIDRFGGGTSNSGESLRTSTEPTNQPPVSALFVYFILDFLFYDYLLVVIVRPIVLAINVIAVCFFFLLFIYLIFVCEKLDNS